MRIKYIDALRGFTMFLVVYFHVMSKSFMIEDSVINLIFSRIRMPMFFFVSGYIGYKVTELFTIGKTWQQLRHKMFVQIVPTIIFYSLFMVCNNRSPMDFFNKGLEGYWFTLSLFELFLIYYTLSFLFNKIYPKHSVVEDILFVSIILISWIPGLYFGSIIDIGPRAIRVLTLPGLFKNMPFFFMGIFFKKYNDKTLLFITNKYVFSMCVVLFVTGLLLLSKCDVYNNAPYLYYTLNSFILPIIGVTMLFAIFHSSSNYFEKNGVVSRQMQFIGRHTLDIYLLHYFLLPKLPDCRNFFFQGGREFVVGEIFIIGVIALAIIFVCLVFSNCMRKSEILAKYMFGIVPKYKR